MKFVKILALLMCFLSAAQAATAPRGSYTAGEYAAAKAKAIEIGKPIAIITTELKSSCPKCQAGNEAVFKQMKDDYVLVINDDKSKEKLPDAVKQRTFPIYKSKGNFIPIVAVLSHTDERLLGGLCYNQISKDGKKAFTTLEKEVADAIAKAPAAQPAPAAKSQQKPAAKENGGSGGMREWVNSDGKSIKAEAISRSETAVTFKLENGNVVDYPLDKLSENSRKVILDTVDSE